ncbi:DUF481 domain-containing protein [Pontibacter sp. JH31]|uniref:DUF481 domain-containing protein n=1 Tax=Pontibacter aquaedesilientis TaxID=2766980 RepID=A0ABR7XDC9_9BACT|nr:DUF481 domain-containing protein [Pontibacter aquaedesilientis]MBD1396285.1 DUF481 domain-containing protein [Pontibacter aquaedesilientis]
MNKYLRNFLGAIPFLLCLVLLSIPAQGQILNIERSRVERDTGEYLTGKAGLNFSMFNRNAGRNNPNNFLQLTFNGDLAYISDKHSYLLLNYYNYLVVNYDTKEQRNTIASNGYSHFRVNLMRQRKLSYEVFAQFQADMARGLERRVLTGGGLRYKVYHSEKTSIFAGTGFMHEHESWKDPEQEGVSRISNLPKSTNYISLRAKLSEQVETNNIAYFQTGYDPDISRMRNRVSGELGINVRLWSRLSMKTNFSCTYEDRPIVPVTRFIYAITNGLQVEF